MNFKHLGIGTIITSIALITGLLVGSLGFEPVLAKISNESNQTSVHVYPQNKSGQTYGSELYAKSSEETPDLIAAVGEDGTEGYVLSADLNGEMPKTPEEAIAIQNKNKSKTSRKIPLYAVDGKTVIGSFKIDNSLPDENTKEEMKKLLDQYTPTK
ncbi:MULTISPECIES: hypothetical protein [Dehalobacter]|jgi:hypothetical protein|uniref:Peptidase M56 BlaR1 n=2 Tax=Dehalobacter restrictus TaxID=55583 RepID=A0A857DHM7_9FIRM|nr:MULTISPECIES: hypothetical protein [Dehalobacter]AHF09824.1 metal ABC transporter substrate-binding protein [Dehalobacter restrictus DSM 9455]MCG1026110.1 hypothetical protein [Dehalobacter sp.]MDJ0305039.1 hypothetical protein [Dehalobacter sp.]OCZ53446.1 hypothetical protein A7D23_07805 [Dehalobacter sp. TeCB1]QHA00407.1 peptidase M56 BlaR1 [Dehalobacter restrictus]